MMTVAQADLVPIIVALLIGLAIAWWIFLRRASVSAEARRSLSEPETTPEGKPVRPWMDTNEGNGVIDEGAAATADVVGQVLNVPVHAELPGAEGPADDLTAMKGVGPKLAQRLGELGITRYEQIARLTPNELEILDEKMGPFKGRLTRDRVLEQAAYLERGDRDGFEAQFGKLGS